MNCITETSVSGSEATLQYASLLPPKRETPNETLKQNSDNILDFLPLPKPAMQRYT